MPDSDEEQFGDAEDFFEDEDGTPSSIQAAEEAVHSFFNNKFDEAKLVVNAFQGKCVYHTFGTAVFDFLEAVMTCEPSAIERASKSIKVSIAYCSGRRKKNTVAETFGNMVKKTNYDNFSTEELHAELCYAQSMLLKALVIILEDETLVSLIKAGIRIRNGYSSYKLCYNILLNRNWSSNDEKLHFESGVRLGIGAFNLLVSMLPSRVIKLLEFIGFSGDKELGLKELEASFHLQSGMMHSFACIILLMYNLIIVYSVSHVDGNMKLCEEIISSKIAQYPNGVWFLYYQGRLEFMKGNISSAIPYYIKSWKSQDLWRQFHHICFWELVSTHMCLQNWLEAYKYMNILCEESKWSKTIYGYFKMSIILMDPSLKNSKQDEIETLITKIPEWKKKVAGKSVPFEKFCVRRCERYKHQNNFLIAPGLELLYMMNLYRIITKNLYSGQMLFKAIDAEIQNFEERPKDEYEYDNRALLLLMKGTCLHHMGLPYQASQCFEQILNLEDCIRYDNFIIPFTLVELALVYYSMHDRERAIENLESVKNNYTGYSMESRLHFRIHSALCEFKSSVS